MGRMCRRVRGEVTDALPLEGPEIRLDTKHEKMDDRDLSLRWCSDLNQASPCLALDPLIQSQMIQGRETIAWKMAIGDNGY